MENTFEILIVEDDETLAAGLCRALLSQGLKAESCGLLKSARAKIRQKNYALLILDVNLPDGDGFDFLCEAKQMCNARIIMLKAVSPYASRSGRNTGIRLLCSQQMT